MTVHAAVILIPPLLPLRRNHLLKPSSLCAQFHHLLLQTTHFKNVQEKFESHFLWGASRLLLLLSPAMQDDPGSSLCTTSPDPDLSQNVSDSQQHTVVADQRGGAHSGDKAAFHPKKNRGKGGADIPPFPRVITTSPAWCADLPWLHTDRDNRELEELKAGRCQQIVSVLGAVSILQAEEKGDISPEELSKCWKLPSAASIEDLPPTLPLIHNPGRRERVVQPLRWMEQQRLDG